MNLKKTVVDQILLLKPQDKFFLIELLVTSLDKPDPTIDTIWLTEAQKRLTAHRKGLSKVIPAKKVLNQEV